MSSRNHVGAARINEAALSALSALLDHWLPGGEQRGTKYVAINPQRQDHHLGVWSRHLMVHHPCKSGRMRYGPDFTRERPHDRGSPSSDTT